MAAVKLSPHKVPGLGEKAGGLEFYFSSEPAFSFWIAMVSRTPVFDGLIAAYSGTRSRGTLAVHPGFPFLITYRDVEGLALSRFKPWLEQRLIEAINTWSEETGGPKP